MRRRQRLCRDRRSVPFARRLRGFTLVEVMIAMLIIALALPAVLLTLDQQIDGTAYLRDKSLAQVVAQNRLAELRLGLRTGRSNLRGALNGVETMADREWFWRVESAATDAQGFTRVTVSVSLEEGENAASLMTLVAYVADSSLQGRG